MLLETARTKKIWGVSTTRRDRKCTSSKKSEFDSTTFSLATNESAAAP
jgi:hypothetical protein